MLKSKLNYHERSKRMWSIKKSRQDNDMIDHISVISVKYDTELTRLVEQCPVYNKDKT